MGTAAVNPIVQNVYNRAAAVTKAVDEAKPQIESISKAEQGLYDNTASVYRTDAQAVAALESTKVAGKYAAEQSALADVLRFGGDNEDSTGIRALLAETYVSNRRQAAEQLQVIKQKKSVGFFDDPVEYLMNALTIGDDIAKHNAANETANAAMRQIQEINATAIQTTQRAAALATTTNASSAVDAATHAATQSLVLANAAQIQGYIANKNGIDSVIKLTTDQLQAAAAAANNWFSLQHLQLAQQREAREAAAHKDAKLGEEELAKDIAGKIRIGYQVMYPSNPEKWYVPETTKILALMRNKVPLDPQIELAYKRGREAFYSQDPNRRSFGDTPVDAIETLRYSPDLSPDAQVTAKYLSQIKEGVLTDKAYQEAKLAKDEEGKRRALNDFIAKKFAQASERIDGVGNPYWLPPINQLAKNIPAFQDLELYKKVLAPAEAAGVDMSEPQQVLRLALRGVDSGKISINDASAQLAAMYRLAQLHNVQSKQFEMFGITPSIEYKVDGTNYADPKLVLREMLNTRIADNAPFLFGAN